MGEGTRFVSGFGFAVESDVAVAVDDARLSISTSDFKRMSHPVLAVEREAQPGDAIRASLLAPAGSSRARSREQARSKEFALWPRSSNSRCNTTVQEMRPSCGFFPATFTFCGKLFALTVGEQAVEEVS